MGELVFVELHLEQTVFCPNRLDRYVPGIPTGRNPHWTESPLDGIPTKFLAVGIPYLGARNPPLNGIPIARLTSCLHLL